MVSPSKYYELVQPRLSEVQNWIAQGQAVSTMCSHLGISTRSWAQYKKDYEEFAYIVSLRVKAQPTQRNESLCWRCGKATGMCSWSKEFKPVAGWTAIPTKVRQNVKEKQPFTPSFYVQECPEFTPDAPRLMTSRELRKWRKIMLMGTAANNNA